jgi:hypothetical protein
MFVEGEGELYNKYLELIIIGVKLIYKYGGITFLVIGILELALIRKIYNKTIIGRD